MQLNIITIMMMIMSMTMVTIMSTVTAMTIVTVMNIPINSSFFGLQPKNLDQNFYLLPLAISLFLSIVAGN